MLGKNLRYLLLVCAALIAGCGQMTDPPAPDSLRTYSSVSQDDSVPPDMDPHFVAIARRVPGYGGHVFMPDGVLRLYLKDLSREAVARAVLSSDEDLYARENGRPIARIEVRRAEYDFLDLTRWRSGAVRRAVMNLPGVTLIRTNRRDNRIDVGVTGDMAEQRARTALEAEGVPLGAVQFPRVTPFVPEAMAVQGGPDSLKKYAPTLQAGRRYVTEMGAFMPKEPNGASACTLGPIGRGKVGTPLEGKIFALTASHCTATLIGTDSTIARQPEYTSGAIGFEAYDGKKFITGDPGFNNCSAQLGCRITDAALLEITDRPAAVGEIARPTAMGGSLQISGTTPKFRVTAVKADFTTGPIHMVGQSSGWRSGTIVDGDHNVDIQWVSGLSYYIWLTNVGIATYVSDEGDSGAPIFTWSSGDTVSIRGIHSGTTTYNNQTYKVFSSMQAIHMDQVASNGIFPVSTQIEWRWGF